MYEGNYKENEIYYNVQMLPVAGHSISEIKNNALDKSAKIAQDDAYFDTVPDRYQSLVPTERYSSIKSGIEENINAAYDTITGKIKIITNAITDYCNGDEVFSPENQVVLDELINNIPDGGTPTDTPKETPSGAPSAPTYDPPTNDEPTPPEPPTQPPTEPPTQPPTQPPTEPENNTDDPEPNKSDDPDDDDELPSVPQVVGGPPQSVSTNIEELTDPNINTEEQDINPELTESFSNSISLPMPTTIAKNDIKKSSIAAPLGITIAAATAIGGKIYYDAKKETEEEEIAETDNFDSQDKEERFLIDKGFASGVNAVKFKKDLINDAEVKENE